jgi:membrane protein
MLMILFFKEAYRRYLADKTPDLSAQCAYYFLLSLFPFLLFLMTLIGYLPLSEEGVHQLIDLYFPGGTNQFVEQNLHQMVGVKRTGLLSFGILITLWSAATGIESLVRAVNIAYGIKEERSYIRSKLIAFALTVAMVLAIFSVLVLAVFGGQIGEYLEHHIQVGTHALKDWHVMRWVTTLVILFVLFTALYVIAPVKRVSLREAAPGAMFATIGWQSVSVAFGYYVDNFANYTATYGGVGAVIILMTWFYLTSFILMIGGQVNATICFLKAERRS